MDEIKSSLDRLQSLNEQEMSDLEAKILSEYETISSQEHTPESVDSMFALADSLEAVRNEQANRVAAAKELQSRAAEAAARITGTQEDGSEEAPTEDTGGETVEEAPVADEAATAVEEAPAEETPEEEATDEKKKPADQMSDASEETAPAAAEAQVFDEMTGDVTKDDEPVVEIEVTTAPEEEEETPAAPVEYATEEVVAEAAVASTDDTSTPVTASADDSTATETDSQEETPMTASGTDEIRNDDAALSRPESHDPVETANTLVTITAGADIPGLTAGTEMAGMKDVASAFVKRLDTVRRVSGGDGEQHVVASFQTNLPEDRILSADRSRNVDLIANALAPSALTAAGVCAPIDAYYEVPGLGVVDRPVRDALVGFGADRGGIRFVPAPALGSFISESDDEATAVGVWSGEDGDRAGELGTGVKPCLIVDCGSEDAVYVDAITACLVFDNMNARAHPEMIAQNNELALVAHARLAELTLLRAIKNAGTARTAWQTLDHVGFARQFLFDVEVVSARYRQTHRLSDSTALRAIIPTWVKSAMRADLVLQAPGDYTFDKADNEIEAFFTKRNITVGWSLETLNAFGTTGAGVFPTAVQWDLFAEGTFLFVDGGNLDLGIIRDSSLVETNAYKQFVETFEAVAKIGAESIHVTSSVEILGAAAALVAVTGLDD
jgi:hypothetical protein